MIPNFTAKRLQYLGSLASTALLDALFAHKTTPFHLHVYYGQPGLGNNLFVPWSESTFLRISAFTLWRGSCSLLNWTKRRPAATSGINPTGNHGRSGLSP